MKQLPALLLLMAAIMLCSSRCPANAASPHDAATSDTVLDSLILHQRYDEVLVENARVLRQRYDSFGIANVSTVEALDRVCQVLSATNDELWQDLSPLLMELTREVYGQNHPKYADALARYALMISRKQNLAEALPLLKEALRLIEPHKKDDWEAYVDILQIYGHYNRWVDGKRAAEIKSEALTIRRAELTSPHVDIASNLLWLGFTLFFNGDHQEGLEYLDQAEQQFQALGLTDLWQLGTIEGVRGESHVLKGEMEEAERAFQRCAKLHSNARESFPPGFGALPKHGYNLLPYVQIKLGKDIEAWQSLQRYREQTTVDNLVLRSAKWEAPQEYRRLQTLGQAYLDAHVQRVALDPQGDRSNYWERLLDEIAAKASLDVARRAYLSAHQLGPIPVETLQSHLGDRTAYIGWLFTPYGDYHYKSKEDVLHVVWAYVLRSSGPVQWIPLFESRDPNDRWDVLGGIVDKMWPSLDDWGLHLQPDARLYAEAKKAGARLLAPLAPYLEGIDELVVEYSGFRIDFPIETLVAPNGEYYGARYAISYSPCARAFVVVTGADSPAPPNHNLLVVGDPVFWSENKAARDPDQSPAASASLDNLRRLTYSGAEVQALAEIFADATVMAREAATAKDLRELVRSSKAQNFDILHFATHALINSGAPERSLLVLSSPDAAQSPSGNGAIDAREITYTWDIDAELVTLSACRTASGPAFRGEPKGFMQAWFAAGARSILASTWRADDEATWILMKRFYESLAGHYEADRGQGNGIALSKVQALREAHNFVRNYEDETGDTPFQHPFYWAGFTLIGNPH